MKPKDPSKETIVTHYPVRQGRIGKRISLHGIGFLLTVALLAYLGPFGTWNSLAVSERVGFWAIAVGVNWFCAWFVFTITLSIFFEREWSPWVGVVLASVITAAPGTAAVWLVVALYLDHRPSGFSEVFRLYGQVAVLQVVIGGLVFHFIERSLRLRAVRVEASAVEGGARGAQPGRDADAAAAAADSGTGAASATDAAGAGDAGTGDASAASDAASLGGESEAGNGAKALLSRLPAPKRGELLHLRMQDHYVEVHTDKGMEMLLLRFRDALQEVEGVDGMQVHRSHWVARAAVEKVQRREGRVVLRLVNGVQVPVSRSFMPALRARGWI